MSTGPFKDIPVLGELPADRLISKLREMGEEETAAQMEEKLKEAQQPKTFGRWDWMPFMTHAWQHTAHAFGFLPAGSTGSGLRDINAIGTIQADSSLKDKRIKIALNQLRVADYPGTGTHRILFDFYGRNQVQGTTEDLHFNATYRVRQGERA